MFFGVQPDTAAMGHHLWGRPPTHSVEDSLVNGWTARYKVLLLMCLICLSLSHLPESAIGQPIQRIEIPSSPTPVGSGARALGMGSAFIAVADDATAASWNPGGLIQLETPEISSVGAFFHRIEDNDFGTNPEASGRETVTEAGPGPSRRTSADRPK